MRFFTTFCFLCLAGIASATNFKVDQKLAQTFENGKFLTNVFVKFKGGNSVPINHVQSASSFSTLSGVHQDQATQLVFTLKSYAKWSQVNALKLLGSPGTGFSMFSGDSNVESFWVTNELFVRGADETLVEQLASLPEVEEIHEENVIPLEAFLPQSDQIDEDPNENITKNEWNIERVKAHEVWRLPGGNGGENVTVANIDTGVRFTHEALRNNYRGDYGWFDPYYKTVYPNDYQGHGTHTMGTLAGSKGIGVAPKAKWISCRGCTFYGCSESALKKCGEWILCPTRQDGSNPDCSKRPRVVSNSWGGGQGSSFYNGVIEAWKAANIIPVFSIGNNGPFCGSANSPGDQDVISVGSTKFNDSISRFSSVGPSVEGKLKPEITAPGELVRSAGVLGDDSYQALSGTSMACPHVAGAVTLLVSKKPNLTYKEILNILTETADKDVPKTGITCGGIPSDQIPNNQYGHGILNARRAVESI